MKNTVKFIILLSIIFPALVCAEIKLYDQFEFEATRSGTGADNFRVTNGGKWASVKTVNSAAASGAAYIYTVTKSEFDSLSGTSNPLPGASPNGRVACFEFLPGTFGYQTDAYLLFGSGAAGYVPANSWFQFWIYPNRYGSQMSQFTNGKMIYPCNLADVGTCTNPDLDWLLVYDKWSMWPRYIVDPENQGGDAWSPNMTLGIASWNGTVTPRGSFGPDDVTPYPSIKANKWTLVKINIDTSNPASGKFRVWLKEYGDANFVQIADYEGGVKPTGTESYPGLFEWTPAFPDGMRWMKLWTTINDYDFWVYMDDFYWATSESDLPTYASIPPSAQGCTISGGTFR